MQNLLSRGRELRTHGVEIHGNGYMGKEHRRVDKNKSVKEQKDKIRKGKEG